MRTLLAAVLLSGTPDAGTVVPPAPSVCSIPGADCSVHRRAIKELIKKTEVDAKERSRHFRELVEVTGTVVGLATKGRKFSVMLRDPSANAFVTCDFGTNRKLAESFKEDATVTITGLVGEHVAELNVELIGCELAKR